jgi:uncharacterized protein YqhQ
MKPTLEGARECCSRFLKRGLRLISLPLLQAPEEALMGGQAVIEGVMMRSPHSYAVAVRRPSGSLAVSQDFLDRPADKHRWLRFPVLRGLGVLGQALVLGLRALRYSAEQALDEGADAKKPAKPAMSNWALGLNLTFSLGFFILFYKFLPLYLATLSAKYYHAAQNMFVFNLIDGLLRLALFLGFLWALSQLKEMQRVFEYHGAEHKVVWDYEKHGAVDVKTSRDCTRFHPRCGTSFLLVVMVIALVIYLFIPFHSFAWRLIARLALLPVIVGASYEFIRYAAKARGRLWKWASAPGLWLQGITTREPDEGQLETAVKALQSALELEKQRGGELIVA